MFLAERPCDTYFFFFLTNYYFMFIYLIETLSFSILNRKSNTGYYKLINKKNNNKETGTVIKIFLGRKLYAKSVNSISTFIVSIQNITEDSAELS